MSLYQFYRSEVSSHKMYQILLTDFQFILYSRAYKEEMTKSDFSATSFSTHYFNQTAHLHANCRSGLMQNYKITQFASLIKHTCAGVQSSLVAISLMTGSSKTTGSVSVFEGRLGLPSGEYASRRIPIGRNHITIYRYLSQG